MKRFLKVLHLSLAIFIVFPTGIIYGIPFLIQNQLDIEVSTIDLANLLKAIMFLYFGFSILWFLGILYDKYWLLATQMMVLFMLAMALGRTASMFIDGLPSKGYIFGTIAEYALGIYAFIQWKREERFS